MRSFRYVFFIVNLITKCNRSPNDVVTVSHSKHDRVTGKIRDDDDDGYGSSSRGRGPSNGRAPGPGNYHPINQNLLFGASAKNSGGEDSNGSGVNKPFVLPTGGNGDDKKQRNAAGTK